MKDNDTRTLASMYDAVAGVDVYESTLIKESFAGMEEYLTEEMVGILGQNISSKLIGLVKREIPSCNDEICQKRLEQMAQNIINSIEKRVSNPMVRRTLKDYEGLSALSKVKVIYQLLSTVQ